MRPRHLGWFLFLTLVSGSPTLAVAWPLDVVQPVGQGKPPRTDAHGDGLPAGAVARLGTTRWQPQANFYVGRTILSPDGKFMAGGPGRAGYPALWDVAAGKEYSLKGALSSCTTLAFSPDSTQLVVAGPHGAVVVDVASRKVCKTLDHVRLRDVVVLHGGKTLVGADYDGQVTWWDLPSGKVTRTVQVPFAKGGPNDRYHFAGLDTAALSPNGKVLIAQIGWYAGSSKLVRDKERTATAWDLASGKELWRVDAGMWGDTAFAFAPDGKLVAATLARGQVHLCEATTGKVVARLSVAEHKLGGVEALAYAPDGKTVAVAGARHDIALWQVTGPRKVRLLRVRCASTDHRPLQTLAFAGDSKTLLVGVAASLQMWDTVACRELPGREGHRGRVNYLRFSADGRQLVSGCGWAVGCSGELLTWDVATWKELRLTTCDDADGVLLTSPDHALCVAGDAQGNLEVRERATGKTRCRLLVACRPWDVGRGWFSPDGKRLVLPVDVQGNEVWWLVDAQTGQPLAALPDDAAGPHVFGQGHAALAWHGTDGAVHVVDGVTGKLRWRLVGRAPKQERFQTTPTLAVTADGKYLAAWDDQDGNVRLWNLATGKEHCHWPAKAPERNWSFSVHLAFSPDGRMLAVGGWRGIELWETATGKHRHTFAGHDGMVTALAWSPGGRLLASGSEDNTVLVWNVVQGPAGSILGG
jgi:WD40 repeat protein